MKKSTKLFIFLELFDILLTVIAVEFLGLWEINPLGYKPSTFIFKFLVIVGVSYTLEKFDFGKLIYILLAVPFLVVIWNIIVILVTLFLT